MALPTPTAWRGAYDLILVARNETRLKALSARLKSETGRSVKVLRADLGNKAELVKVEATLRDDPSITVLVNSAGITSVAPLLNADVEKMEDIIDLNVIALTRLTHAAAPTFVARGEARNCKADFGFEDCRPRNR